MPTKRKTLKFEDLAPANGEIRDAVFGWCTTGHHENCRVEFPGHKCNCECHGEANAASKPKRRRKVPD